MHSKIHLVAFGTSLLFSLANCNVTKRGMKVDTYKMYSGSVNSQEWPSRNEWYSSFDDMFAANVDSMRGSCAQWGVPNNSNQELRDIYNGIKTVSSETQVDARFILAVMIQESAGCVRAPTTNYGVRNPGLMQSHDGSGTCNNAGLVQTPCPSNNIVQMLRDGAGGTSSGDGLRQLLMKAPGSGDARYFAAARMYNSGSIAPSGDLGAGIATHCYSSNVANRLTGWISSRNTCSLDGAPSGHGSASLPVTYDFSFSSDGSNEHMEPAPAPKPAAEPKPAANPPAVHQAPAAQPVSKVPSHVKATSNRMAPGVTTNCAQYYRVQQGDFCHKVSDKFGITFAQLRTLNVGIDSGCSNLWLDYDYCVKGL